MTASVAPAPDLGTTGAADDRTRSPWVLALPGIVVAVVAALIGLDRRSLWVDEALTLGATNQLSETISGTSGTMAGYYAVVTPWSWVSESVWWLRLLSVLFAAAAVVATVAIARRLAGDRLAVVAGVVLGLSVPLTRYAQELRAYALVILLVATIWWVFLRAVDETDPERRARWWTALAALSCFVVTAHGLAVLTVLAVGVAALLHPERARVVRGVVPAIGVALLTVGVLLANGANDVGSFFGSLRASQVVDAASFYTSPVWWVALLLGAAFVVGAVTSWSGAPGDDALAVWRSRAVVVWAVVPFAGLIALSAARPSMDPRYLIGITPAVAIVLARSTTRFAGDAGRHGPVARWAVLALVLALVPGQVVTHRDTTDDWRAAVRVVAAEARPGDGIALTVDFHRPPLEAAWQEEVDLPWAPTLVDFDRPLGTVRRYDEPRLPEAVGAARADVDRLWVVTVQEPYHGTIEDFLDRPEIRRDFTVARTWSPGGRTRVALLEHR